VGRRSVVCALTLALCLLLAPAAAEAKRVTETAPGVLVPDAAPTSFPVTGGEATQTFELRGSKVKGKQVLDVNVILNASEPAPFVLSSMTIFLFGPKGNAASLSDPSSAPTWANLKLDDQSNQRSCDPMQTADARCNYWQGQTATGSVHARINPLFRGTNPKGEWTLLFFDGFPDNDPPTTIGVSTLEVKTGRKFEKDAG
jgi:hypothetical protein